MRRLATAVLCVTVAAIAACGRSEEQSSASAATQQTALPPPSSMPASGASGVGVAPCDEYIRTYTECASSKVPAAVRAAMVAAVDQTRAQWTAAAATPEGRAGLVQACTQARQAGRASLQTYGCRW
jgi:hypothetical protein